MLLKYILNIYKESTVDHPNKVLPNFSETEAVCVLIHAHANTTEHKIKHGNTQMRESSHAGLMKGSSRRVQAVPLSCQHIMQPAD